MQFSPQKQDAIDEALTNIARLLDYSQAAHTLLGSAITSALVAPEGADAAIGTARRLVGEGRAVAEQIRRDLEALAARQHEKAREHSQAVKHVGAEVSR
ncbi:MAG: hypothetical protein ACHQWU_09120 [Gemmatimonadales bacterium]